MPKKKKKTKTKRKPSKKRGSKITPKNWIFVETVAGLLRTAARY